MSIVRLDRPERIGNRRIFAELQLASLRDRTWIDPVGPNRSGVAVRLGTDRRILEGTMRLGLP